MIAVEEELIIICMTKIVAIFKVGAHSTPDISTIFGAVVGALMLFLHINGSPIYLSTNYISFVTLNIYC